MMSREEKQQSQQAELQKQLWSIANTLRGNMDANDFKNYMRGIKRIPHNNIMPNYTSAELSDLDIEKMYEILKDGR